MKLNDPVKFNGSPLLGVDDISVAYGNLIQDSWEDKPTSGTVWVRIDLGPNDVHKSIITPYMDASVISTSFKLAQLVQDEQRK